VLFNIICRLGKPDHKPNPLLWFYNTGIGGTDGVNSKKWSLKTFPTLLRENNHSDVCIFVHLTKNCIRLISHNDAVKKQHQKIQDQKRKKVRKRIRYARPNNTKPKRISNMYYAHCSTSLQDNSRCGFWWLIAVAVDTKVSFSGKNWNTKAELMLMGRATASV